MLYTYNSQFDLTYYKWVPPSLNASLSAGVPLPKVPRQLGQARRLRRWWPTRPPTGGPSPPSAGCRPASVASPWLLALSSPGLPCDVCFSLSYGVGGLRPPLLSSSLSDSRPYTGTCAALQSRSCSSSSSTVACGGAPARGDLAPVRRSPCLGPSLCCAGWADGTWGFLIPPSSLLPVYDEVNEVAFHSLDRLLLEVKFLLPPVQAGGGAAPPICFPARFQHGAALDGPKHGPPPTCDIDHDRWKS